MAVRERRTLIKISTNEIGEVWYDGDTNSWSWMLYESNQGGDLCDTKAEAKAWLMEEYAPWSDWEIRMYLEYKERWEKEAKKRARKANKTKITT